MVFEYVPILTHTADGMVYELMVSTEDVEAVKAGASVALWTQGQIRISNAAETAGEPVKVANLAAS
jgi:hypothetical protein